MDNEKCDVVKRWVKYSWFTFYFLPCFWPKACEVVLETVLCVSSQELNKVQWCCALSVDKKSLVQPHKRSIEPTKQHRNDIWPTHSCVTYGYSEMMIFEENQWPCWWLLPLVSDWFPDGQSMYPAAKRGLVLFLRRLGGCAILRGSIWLFAFLLFFSW